MPRYNTNLAAEFRVLSMLNRLGLDASLTLGNRKSVDILIEGDDGSFKTVDVKGLEKQYDWPADNIRLPAPENHFYVFLTFDGKVDDPGHPPSAWVIPAGQVNSFIKKYKTRTVAARSLIRKHGAEFYQAWQIIGDT